MSLSPITFDKKRNIILGVCVDSGGHKTTVFLEDRL